MPFGVRSNTGRRARSGRAQALDDMAARIEECRGSRRSNCIGTALYIVGEIEEDRHIEPHLAQEYLMGMETVERPELGCLVAWQEEVRPIVRYDASVLRFYGSDAEKYEEIVRDNSFTLTLHLGVMTYTDPLLVTSRWGFKGKFFIDQPLSEASMRAVELIGIGNSWVAYYAPKSMTQEPIKRLLR
ncbi:MAG: hypothetical protein M1354_03850 [Candidatus Marsarchaeota archaeon]|nr:hypothetical protein [Candidatus Marsarchaeota archaeon]